MPLEEVEKYYDIEVPEHLTEDQKSKFRELLIISRKKGSGFKAAAIEAMATNPEVMERYTEAHRKLTIKTAAQIMSRASGKLLDQPLDIIKVFLDLPERDKIVISTMAQVLSDVNATKENVQISDADLKSIIDLAKVTRVMEEDTDDTEGEFREDSLLEESLLKNCL